MSSSTTTLPAIGVDVGFYSTKFTTGRRDKSTRAVDVMQFPSVAPRISGSMKAITAADQLSGVLVDVEPGALHFVGADVYQVAPTTGARAVTSDYSLSSDYKALFLGALHYIAKEHAVEESLQIDTLVAGLPFSTVYTHANELAAFIKGVHKVPHPLNPDVMIPVQILHAMVIAQPQGALVAHGVDTASSSHPDFNTLVLDMGGGTFDWFMAKGIRPNRALSGAAPIGTLACAAAICDEIKPGLKDNPDIMARVDRALREGSATVRVTGRDHSMDVFEPVVSRVLADAIEQMRKSVGSLDSVDKILVTGGGARLIAGAFRAALPEYAHLLEMDKEPVVSKVRGFHAIAEFQARNHKGSKRSAAQNQVIPSQLGSSSLGRSEPKGGK